MKRSSCEPCLNQSQIATFKKIHSIFSFNNCYLCFYKRSSWPHVIPASSSCLKNIYVDKSSAVLKPTFSLCTATQLVRKTGGSNSHTDGFLCLWIQKCFESSACRQGYHCWIREGFSHTWDTLLKRLDCRWQCYPATANRETAPETI